MEKKSSHKEKKEHSSNKKRERSRSKSPSPKKIIEKYPQCPQKGSFKIIHWNVNGLRPLLKSKELNTLISKESPDMLCLNETKVDNETIQKNSYNTLLNDKYKSYFNCASIKKGYSGTAILTKYNPIKVTYGLNKKKHDQEGRVITAEYPSFYLIACYTPNAGDGLKRLGYRIDEWDKDFFEYINTLKQKKDIILCGDLNVAHKNIDIYEPKGHENSPGFTQKEKESFTKFLAMGYIDTFRLKHPKEQKFSFFTKRSFKTNMKKENKGWRLDYFVINNKSNIDVTISDMLEKNDYNSSDHIPIKIEFNIK